MNKRFFRDNGLTLALMVLFFLSWIGQFLTGHHEYNKEQREHKAEPVTIGGYVHTGHFWQATGENWESEFLQMALFVLLTIKLVQRGSPESNDPDKPEKEKSRSKASPWPVKKGGAWLFLYAHSLSIAFILLFLLTGGIHAAGGYKVYREENVQHGMAPGTLGEYLTGSEFWFQSFQNWQSEFLSLAAMVFLSVYLRERGSAESKQLASAHSDHE